MCHTADDLVGGDIECFADERVKRISVRITRPNKGVVYNWIRLTRAIDSGDSDDESSSSNYALVCFSDLRDSQIVPRRLGVDLLIKNNVNTKTTT